MINDGKQIETLDTGDNQLASAIYHSQQVAESYADTAPECECRKQHLQLVEWLGELASRRVAEDAILPGTDTVKVRI